MDVGEVVSRIARVRGFAKEQNDKGNLTRPKEMPGERGGQFIFLYMAYPSSHTLYAPSRSGGSTKVGKCVCFGARRGDGNSRRMVYPDYSEDGNRSWSSKLEERWFWGLMSSNGVVGGREAGREGRVITCEAAGLGIGAVLPLLYASLMGSLSVSSNFKKEARHLVKKYRIRRGNTALIGPLF